MTLFDPDTGPNVRDSDPRTAQVAALLNPTGRDTQRKRIVDWLGINHRGTSEAIAFALGMRVNICARRITDLNNLGMVVDSGARQRTSLGSMAIAWELDTSIYERWSTAQRKGR